MKEQAVYAEECNQFGRHLSLECHFSKIFFWNAVANISNVTCSGVNLKPLVHASQNYQVILAENKKLFNEVQELKGSISRIFLLVFSYVSVLRRIHTWFFYAGNIRVFCRIRPFHVGKKETQTIIEDIGENDLVVENPTKGKDALRSFKFNKIFSPAATQGLFLYTLRFLRLGYGDTVSFFLCIHITVFR